MRKWVGLIAVAVIAIGAAVVFLTHRAQDEAHAQDVAAWHTQLQEWEETRAQQLQPPQDPLLSDVVTGAAMAGVQVPGPAALADVDQVNAACTTWTSFASEVQSAPGPPAAPAGSDFTPAEQQRFDDDLQALQQLRNTIDPAASTIRRFCGTYPLLISAHVDGGDDSGQLIAQALATQCPLPQLEQACRKLHAAASGRGDAATIDSGHVRAVISDQLETAEQTIDAAAATFHERLQG